MSHNRQKKIAVVNDFSGFGRCSITAALPIISAMKIQCCPIPTSIFSNHTGYESFYFTDYTEHMSAYIDQWVKLGLEFNGILTGFLGSQGQIAIVRSFLEQFKTDSGVVVVDPVMGDGGKLYPTYSEALSKQMSGLVEYADILTPNVTEACILTNTDYKPDISESELFEICEKLSGIGPAKIVISGIERGDDFENFVYERGSAPQIIRAHKTGPCRAGTGDVFSSIIVADAVNGKTLSDSVRHATEFIAKSLRKTVELGLPETDGICFEELLTEI